MDGMTKGEKMRAIVLEQFGSVANFRERDVPIGRPGRGQVLIDVAAGSVNPIDIKTRVGRGAAKWFPVIPPVILGWDIAGKIVNCGPDTDTFSLGEDVFGAIGFPGLAQANADYVIADVAHIAKKPASISFEESAAAAMAGLTAWQAFNQNDGLHAGQKVLVHGASGGVGHLAVQMAKACGCHVTGTSSGRNRQFVQSLGADGHIDYQKTPIPNYPGDFDFILDPIGGDVTLASLGLLKQGGHLVTLNPPGDDQAERKARELGVVFQFILMKSSSSDMEQVAKLLGSRVISAHISASIPLSHLADAHLLMESGRTVGKISLIR
ncbi:MULTISPECIES: NADP-dependent oxidoreductase [Gluconobacter]|nr:MULTISPECIES: NADP-dependent oxidoreductase [Gluconobacter]